MTAVESVIATARKEVGYLEKKSNAMLDDKTANAGSSNWTKYARDLDALGVYNGKKNGYAWCDVFVDWCFIMTFGLETAMKMLGQPMGGYGAGCTWSAEYYRRAGRFFTGSPKAGDQIFFTNDSGRTSNHTGLVVGVSGGRVYTIEGNTSGKAGVVANGGGVQAKSYSLSYSKIFGYGRPDYTIVQNSAEEDDDMDVKRFKELWAEMRKELQDNDAGKYSEEARAWAVSSGLIRGSGTVNGEPNYMWEDILSRQQMITILYRFSQMMGMV